MRGLKTQEGNKFEKFFSLVQSKAREAKSVFFLDCGEGNDFSTNVMEGEDLRGWLIPTEKADAFEREWLQSDPGDEWEDYITWALWHGAAENPTIEMKKF